MPIATINAPTANGARNPALSFIKFSVIDNIPNIKIADAMISLTNPGIKAFTAGKVVNIPALCVRLGSIIANLA